MISPGLSEREQQIINLVASESNVSIKKLGIMLGVSTVTVRSDLTSLTEKGIITRTRGKVIPTFNASILQRQRTMAQEKARIAKAAAALIQEGDTVFVEAGTTAALIGRFLFGKWNIRIVTNSLLVVPHLRTNPGIQLCVIGGDYRPHSDSLVGPIALKQLETFHVRYAFVGADGFSIEDGFTANMPEAAEIARKMAERSETTVVLADSSKCGKRGFAAALPFNAIQILITDSGLDVGVKDELERASVSVMIV